MDNSPDSENRSLVHPTIKKPFDWQKWLVALIMLLAAAAGSWYLYQHNKITKDFYVPRHDLPAYHRILETDLVTQTIPVSVLQGEVLTTKDELVGHYTLEMLEANESVAKSQVISSPSTNLVDDTTAISIPASAAMTFNGKLSSGTVVSVWNVSSSNDQGGNKTTLILNRALVLDVQQSEGSSEAGNYPYVIVLAIPIHKQEEILTAAAANSISFTLAP